MENRNRPNICVVGGGIIGLSSAYGLAINYPGCKITIIAEKLAPDTVSNHSFGSIFVPKMISSYSSPKNEVRTISTFNMCMETLKNNPELAKNMGISVVNGFHIVDKKEGLPDKEYEIFRKTVLNFHKVDEKNIQNIIPYSSTRIERFQHLFGRKDLAMEDIEVYKYGFIIIDCELYLPWLQNQLELLNKRGRIESFKIIQKKLSSLEDVCDKDFDLVVNCSGLGARELVKDDKVLPIRGQYLVCKKPLDFPFYASYGTVCFPVSDRVLVGGIFQEGREDFKVDPIDTEDLIRRSSALWPSVKEYILDVKAAIRPARVGGTRLETEIVKSKEKQGKHTAVIHNYGHGPKGFMLHWGCTEDVLKLANIYFKNSKL